MKGRIGFLVAGAVVAAGIGLVQVPSRAGDNIATVAVGNSPLEVAISPDSQRAYISNVVSDDMSVVSLASNAVTATVAVGDGPRGVVVTDDGSRVFVANRNSNTISVFDTASGTVTGSIPVGDQPTGLALSPDGSQLFVTRFSANRLTVLSTSTFAVVGNVDVGAGPYPVAISADGAFAYVGNRTAGTVSVVALPALTVQATVAVGAEPFTLVPYGTGSARTVFVTNYGPGANSVMKLSATGGAWAVERVIPMPGRPLGAALSRDAATLYVSQYAGGSLSQVKLSTGAITAIYPLGANPTGVAVSPDGSRAVVANHMPAPGTVTVLDLVPRVALLAAESVRGTTATVRASVSSSLSEPATGIECRYATDAADLADPFTSAADDVAAAPATAAANTTAAVDCPFTGLTRGTEYFYTAVATDSDGMGAAMAVESFTTRPPKPAKPDSVRAKKRSVKLTWSATRSATYYEARIRQDGVWSGWKTKTAPKVLFRKLDRRTLFKIQYRAGNDSGTGPRRSVKVRTR